MTRPIYSHRVTFQDAVIPKFTNHISVSLGVIEAIIDIDQWMDDDTHTKSSVSVALNPDTIIGLIGALSNIMNQLLIEKAIVSSKESTT